MPNSQESKWFKSPTKKQLILCTTIWFVSTTLFLLWMMDLSDTSNFAVRDLVICFLLLSSTVTMVSILVNYYKNALPGNWDRYWDNG